jgi:hypothetical protein
MATSRGGLLAFRGLKRRRTSDLELLCLLSMGDNAALRDLFYRHGDLVFRVLRTDHGFDTPVAGRLARDTFLEVSRSGGAWDPRHCVVGWIVRTALKVGARGSFCRGVSPSDVPLLFRDIDANGSVGEAITLEECVAALPWRIRMATVLVDRERLNAEAAADALGVKPRVLWRLVAKGRWRMRPMRVERGAVYHANRFRRALTTGRLCPPAWLLNQAASSEITPRIGWHLSACPDCSRELAELMQISDRLASLPRPKMGAALKNEIAGSLLTAPHLAGLN